MARKHQGLRQRIAEAQRREKSESKRLARLARRSAKRKQALAMNVEVDSGRHNVDDKRWFGESIIDRLTGENLWQLRSRNGWHCLRNRRANCSNRAE